MVPHEARAPMRLPARIIDVMLVAVDAGNSEVKLALVRDGRVVAMRRAASRARTAAYDAEGMLLDTLGGRGAVDLSRAAETIEAIVMVSVVPPWTEAVMELARRLGRPMLHATHATVPLPVALAQPERIGADRLVGAFAALRLHGAPVIIVDLGTATTIDAVGPEGSFRGGAIAPGPELGLAALASGTAQLPRVALAVPTRAIGRDTAEAVVSGVVLGHVGVVREIVTRIFDELSEDAATRPKVIATGGLSAAPWAALLQGLVDVIDPRLTLKGLALLHTELRARAVS